MPFDTAVLIAVIDVVVVVFAVFKLVLNVSEMEVMSVLVSVDIPLRAVDTDSCRPDIASVVEELAPSHVVPKDSVMELESSEILVSMAVDPPATS